MDELFVWDTCIIILGRSFLKSCWKNQYGKLRDQFIHKHGEEKWRQWEWWMKMFVYIWWRLHLGFGVGYSLWHMQNVTLFLNNMLKAFNSVILESRAKPSMTIVEEIRIYVMERWTSNMMRFPNLSDMYVLSNIKRKIERTNTYTKLWIVR